MGLQSTFAPSKLALPSRAIKSPRACPRVTVSRASIFTKSQAHQHHERAELTLLLLVLVEVLLRKAEVLGLCRGVVT
jgi:hypothetical protein